MGTGSRRLLLVGDGFQKALDRYFWDDGSRHLLLVGKGSRKMLDQIYSTVCGFTTSCWINYYAPPGEIERDITQRVTGIDHIDLKQEPTYEMVREAIRDSESRVHAFIPEIDQMLSREPKEDSEEVLPVEVLTRLSQEPGFHIIGSCRSQDSDSYTSTIENTGFPVNRGLFDVIEGV